jgi:hypothetical protein
METRTFRIYAASTTFAIGDIRIDDIEIDDSRASSTVVGGTRIVNIRVGFSRQALEFRIGGIIPVDLGKRRIINDDNFVSIVSRWVWIPCV